MAVVDRTHSEKSHTYALACWASMPWGTAFFKIVVASTVFSGRLFLRLLFLLPLGVECHRSDRRPVACGA